MLEVAIDSGPLHGHRTGIGNAVAWYLDAFERSDERADVALGRYVTSARASLGPGERRLPVPAAVALRWWARASLPRIDRFLGRPAVVHGTNYVVPPTAAARVVSVYDCWFLDHPESAHRDVRLASAVLVRSLREGATALVSSTASAERLAAHVDTDRIEVVHLGPPPLERIDERPADATLVASLEAAPFVVSLGTIERRKNVPTLIRAFGRLAAEHERVRCVIAGADGDDATQVAAAVDELDEHARRRVVRAGRVDAPTKRWLLTNAAALAYPSLDEGFGFPLLEAQQAGLPIAASTAGSIPEVAGSGASYSAPSDADALAANLFGLLEDGPTRGRLVENGRRNLERFSWADCVAATAALYRRLAGDRT